MPLIRQHTLTVVFIALTGLSVSRLACGIPMQPDETMKSLSSGAPRLFSTPESTTGAGPGMQDRALQAALKHINQGQPDKALPLIRNYLQTNPQSAPAHELLGAALAMEGQLDAALEALHKAIAINPKQHTAYTKIADILLAQNQPEAAMEQLLKAVEQSPEGRLPHQRLGLLYEKAGNDSLAQAHFEKGIAGTPADYMGVKLNLAGLYNRNGDFAKTRALLEPALQGKTGETTAHVLLGTAYMGLGQMDAALTQFETARKQSPDLEGAYLGLGVCYRAKQQYAESEQALKQVVKLRPDWSTGHFQLGETNFLQGKHQQALSHFQQAQKLNPDSLLVQKRIGDCYTGLGQLDSAIAIYNRLAREPSIAPMALAALGTARQLNGQPREAETAFKQLVELLPKDPLAHLQLGEHYAVNKDYTRALASFREGLALDPSHPGLLKASALAYSRLGDDEHAIDSAHRLSKAQPDNLDAAFLLGSLQDSGGQLEAAEATYRGILARQPGHLPTLNNLAMSLANRGDGQGALRMLEPVLEQARSEPLIQDTYGWALFKAGKPQEAMKVLEQARAMSPKDPSILFHLGSVYAATGARQQAKDALGRALGISDTFREAAQAREMLDTL